MKRLLFAVILAGCAVQRAEKAPAASPAASPATGTSTAPTTTTADEEDASGGGDKATKAPSPAPAPNGASGTVVMPDVAKAQASFDDASQAFKAAGNDCAQLCKALGSMTHATDRLCELSGADQRCTDAKTRLDSARAKVKSTCGTC